MGYGEIIRKVRKEAGLTQRELAEKAGLSLITIQQYEAGKRTPKLENIMKLAEVLEIPATDLMQPTRKNADSFETQIKNSREEMNAGLDFGLDMGAKAFFLNDTGREILKRYAAFLYSFPEYRKEASNFKKPSKENFTFDDITSDWLEEGKQEIERIKEQRAKELKEAQEMFDTYEREKDNNIDIESL